MSQESKRVTVRILDKEYHVACRPEEKDALLTAAQELDRRMRQIRHTGGAVLGADRLAVMVALNLCHELQQERAKPSGIGADALERMSIKLDGALSS